jgi:hypothetical protein
MRLGIALSHAAFAFPSMSVALHLSSSPTSYTFARRWRGTRAYWLCQLIGWGGLFIAWILPLLVRGNDIGYEVLYGAALAFVGLGISHLLRVVLIFHLRAPRSWRTTLLRLGPWIIAASLAHSGFLLWTIGQMPPTCSPVLYYTERPSGGLFAYFDSLTVSGPILAIWTGFYLGLRYYRQYQVAQLDRLKLDAAMKEAELRSLKAQLNPHFLFNSLNSLRALIPRDLAPPREALTLLTDLLRASLTTSQEATIPFSRELETVDNYLALERLRFEDRLVVHRDVDPATHAWLIPPFLLQTLVENAIKFGLNPREEGAEISLEATVRAGQLHVRVRNPGTLVSSSVSTGLGLQNSRARLRLLFGPTATLELRQATPEVVEAELRLPPLPPATA